VTNAEYRLFGCEGLVCINPDFYGMNKNQWFSALIPNGVDAERFKNGKSNRLQFGLPADRTIVLMVSALIPSKRVDVAIEVVSRVPDVHLSVAGDGPMRASILAKAQQLLPDRFTNLTLTAKEMPDLYRSADLFLHMSLEESFGNVFLEAMASGLPVIAHDSPRLRWIIGDNGQLLNTQNVDEVANCIARAGPPAAEHGEALQAAASKFDWSKIAIEYERFFRQVIDRSRGRNTGLPA
jgi:glycosyltransferase involved in cell wall biosynthesis